MSKSILLIAGQKRSGKDTLATLIHDELERLGRPVQIVSFAGPMKRIMATTLGITLEELDDLKNDESNPHRGYLQRFGSEAMKPEFGNDVWLELAKQAVLNAEYGTITIFADFRFETEFNIISVAPAYTLKVIRPELGPVPEDSHISETALEDFKFNMEIVNDGDLLDLRASAIEVAQWL